MRATLKCVFKTFAVIAILATLAMPVFAANEHEIVTGGVAFPLGGDSLWMGGQFLFDYDNDYKCTMVLDLGSQTTKDIARILIRNWKDSGTPANVGRANIYVASQDGSPGFDPNNRASYDTLVGDQVAVTPTDAWQNWSEAPNPIEQNKADASAWVSYHLDRTVTAKRYFCIEIIETASGASLETVPGVYLSDVNYLALQDLPNITEASGTITCDGDFSDWGDINWIPLNRGYVADIHPADVTQAEYAAKWSNAANKLYLAVRVLDTQHIFKNDNNEWGSRDTVEIYFHNSPIAPLVYGNYSQAQQFIVGIREDDPTHSSVWTSFGSGATVPPHVDLKAGGKEDGQWLYYEVGLTPFKNLDLAGDGAGNAVVDLDVNSIMGLDFVVESYNQATPSAWMGMLTAQSQTHGELFQYWSLMRLHKLAAAPQVNPVGLVDGKKAADGAAVAFTGAVTVTFGDYFYVEDSNRSSGIRVVKANSGVAPGQLVNIAGTMGTLDSGERFVNGGIPVPAGSLSLKPVGLSNRSMGGGNLGDPATGKGQTGVSDGAGLNNIGLYVKVWGKVTVVGGKYKLNDGSGVDVTIEVTNGTIADGAFVLATGIMSCQKDTSGNVTRLLLVKDSATDIRSL